MSDMIGKFQQVNKRRQEEGLPITPLAMFAEAWDAQQKVIDEYVMVAESLEESYVRECKKNKALQKTY